jgi:hypothetical protein
MAYIGRDTDKISNVEVLDNITFDGSSSYTLQKGGSNFTPSSANTLLLSIDGVVQAGNFTVSGSTIDFGTAVAGTSTCDFILHYGVGLITAPSDGTVTSAKIGANAVTNAKLNNDIISGATELATEPADTDEFLVSDAGTLKRIDYSLIKGGGITMAESWRVSADFTGDANPISSNWEKTDTDGYGNIGSSMTESSGIFTFPSTGIYLILFRTSQSGNGGAINTFASARIRTTTDNSTYDTAAENYSNNFHIDSYSGVSCEFIFDVTNTTTHKVRFAIEVNHNGTVTLGDSGNDRTTAKFIRLGDT